MSRIALKIASVVGLVLVAPLLSTIPADATTMQAANDGCTITLDRDHAGVSGTCNKSSGAKSFELYASCAPPKSTPPAVPTFSSPYVPTGARTAVRCPKGLTVSQYVWRDKKGHYHTAYDYGYVLSYE